MCILAFSKVCFESNKEQKIYRYAILQIWDAIIHSDNLDRDPAMILVIFNPT